MHAHTNRLLHETSPYLLQHAHNPVDWHPWSEDAFALAEAQGKLVLVSIGYSSCHWCHVMERESFESEAVARVMNERFICIKVDREERPDVDQVYMTAVQLMTGRGGWPLNCFTLPDGRPVYGGTYFPPEQWTRLLQDLDATWRTDPDKVRSYAERLHEGVRRSELVELNTDAPAFDRADAEALVERMEATFDHTYGGADHVPKFPMPNNYELLLRFAWLMNDGPVKQHVRLTLDRMAQGGLFDQVGGGFARYSTDERWKVPHFEKMLYDNAQLIALYSQAYQAFKDEAYRDVVERTIAFVQRELMSPEGAFYSALDADSEGEEGRFYVWTEAELAQALGDDLAFAKDYYNVNARGAWEHGRYILLREEGDAAFARRHGLDAAALRERTARIQGKLLAARAQRERPALDDKALTSWNAMMVSGLCAAFNALGTEAYRDAAQRTMRLLLTRCRRADGGLWHSYKAGRATINGYLEDYAFVLEALLALYQCTFDEAWLEEARALADQAIVHFHDEATGMFHFTSDLDPPLIARRTEVHDNVTPASNSSLAKALFGLGHLFDDRRMLAISEQQLNNVLPHMHGHPSGYSNWAQLLLMHVLPFHEVAITGPEALQRQRELAAHYTPGCLFLGAVRPSALPLLAEKPFDTTRIFVCVDKTCRLPVTSAAEALQQLR